MHCALQNSMNFGSQILALLNEHAVEHALGSIMLPQDALQSAPLGLEHAKPAEVLHEDSHFPMQSLTGSSAGLLSGMTITWGSSLGITFIGMRLRGTGSGWEGAGCGAGSGTGALVTTTSFGPSGEVCTITAPEGDFWQPDSSDKIRNDAMTLTHKARNDICNHQQQKYYADKPPNLLTLLLLKNLFKNQLEHPSAINRTNRQKVEQANANVEQEKPVQKPEKPQDYGN